MAKLLRKWLVALVAVMLLASMMWQVTPDRGLSPTASEGFGEGAAGQVANMSNPLSLTGLPLSFEPNVGQAAAGIGYIAHGSSYTLLISGDGATMALKAGRTASIISGLQTGPQQPAPSSSPSYQTVSFQLAGARGQATLEGEGELAGKSNYFIGNDPASWHTDVPNYGRVRVRGVYAGIDMLWYGSISSAEYDFVLQAGADPSQIRMKIAGATVEQVGDELALHTSVGTLRQRAPHIYQPGANGQQQIGGSYVLLGKDEVGFKLSAYDTSKPLTIDPQLGYSTYFGANGEDTGLGIALDGQGDIYITGDTASTNFYTTTNPTGHDYGGGQDAFISELNPSGSALIYSAYIGGSGDDEGKAVAVDSSGEATLTGYTYSGNFPTHNPIRGSYGGAEDGFVLKLNAAGNSFVYSTYLGGSDGDVARAVKLNSVGDAYVTGYTTSTNYITTTGALQPTNDGGIDAFLTRVSGTGALIYSTYLGGFDNDEAEGVALDGNNNIYLTGATASLNFTTTVNAIQGANQGSSDAFVTKINAAGTSVLYSTYLGGVAFDQGIGVSVDITDNIYVAGWSHSPNFYLHNPLQGGFGGGYSDNFITKIGTNGAAIYSTYLGGNDTDQAAGLTLDNHDEPIIVGSTASGDYPVALPLTTCGTNQQPFISKLNAGGTALVYSTCLSGNQSGTMSGAVVDLNDNDYFVGSTSDTNFPTASPFQGNNRGGNDAIIVEVVNNLTPPTSTPTHTATPTATHTPTEGPSPTPGPPTDTPGPTNTPGTPTATPPPVTPGPSNTPGGPTPTICPNPFVDISGNIFYGAISYLYCAHAVSGTDGTHFSPANTATRGQFARTVVKGFGIALTTPAGGGQSFTDVPQGYFAYNYIESGKAAGILSGYDQNTCTQNGAIYPCYLPNRFITRAELTRLVVKAAHYLIITPTSGPTFVDVPPSYFAYNYIETAVAHRVVHGTDATHFAPARVIRRDEMCQIVFKGITNP